MGLNRPKLGGILDKVKVLLRSLLPHFLFHLTSPELAIRLLGFFLDSELMLLLFVVVSDLLMEVLSLLRKNVSSSVEAFFCCRTLVVINRELLGVLLKQAEGV